MTDSTTIAPQTIVRRSESILHTELENEVVMMDIDEGNYYGLEEAAARIWSIAEQPRSVAEICSTLQNEYEISPEQCRSEVITFLEELKTRKVVNLSNP